MPILFLYLVDNSIIPSLTSDIFNSDSEQSIPEEVMPLILATTNFVFVFGIIAPGGAYIVINPSFAFSAPFLIGYGENHIETIDVISGETCQVLPIQSVMPLWR